MFQAYNTERYHQAMILIKIEKNEKLSQRITKWCYRVELQDSGGENILMRYAMMVIWKRNGLDNGEGLGVD